MAYAKYPYGSVVHLEANFVRPDTGAAFDPDAVVLTVVQPDGAPIVVSGLTPEETGKFIFSLPVHMAGTWEYRFDGTGTLAAGGRKRFTVQEEF